MTTHNNQSITSLKNQQHPTQVFQPPTDFQKHALINDQQTLDQMNQSANADPEKFWAAQAQQLIWYKQPTQTLDWQRPFARWFVNGQTNASANCLDRHLTTARQNKTALIWQAESGEVQRFSYQELHSEVCKLANTLKKHSVQTGDVVTIYMGMVPQAIIAMLACARIGAIHNVVFGGFSADSLVERMNDSKSVCLLTQDVVLRRGQFAPLKASVHEALTRVPSLKKVLVFNRNQLTRDQVPMLVNRDFWWDQETANSPSHCEPTAVNSEHPLFVLYTSGSTGKPKGIVHSTAGYLTQVAFTTKLIFDLKEPDIYFCTADIGWITGHSYVTYGPLLQGATVFLYEGVLNYPEPDRIWQLIAHHKITILYTAPTAIRSFMKAGEAFPARHDLSSLRLLGSVGEPINPEAWLWYHKVIGGGRCPIVDTWWQTETGAIMIAPIPGVTATRPGTATQPLPGILADVVRRDGSSCNANEGGLLVIKKPWPSMLLTILGNEERYRHAYWSDFEYYFTGDGARRDEHGNIWIMGRVDDVVNVSGHRLGTAEIESALVAHPAVAEAAVVARPDQIKGNALIAFVTLKNGFSASAELSNTLRQWVAQEIGAIARPDEIRLTDSLPKTRSGKIMRRLLRELVSGKTVQGDTSTLEDLSVLETLRLTTTVDEE